MLARLKAGVTIEKAQAEISVLYRALLEQNAGQSKNPRMQTRMELLPAGAGLVRVRDQSARPESLSETVRQAIGALLKNVRVSRMTTLARQLDSNIVPERLIATLSQFFGVLGMVLAGIGMYGLLAYTVVRRTNEIGIRIALGATDRDVRSLVLRDALRMVCGGLVTGFVLLLLSRLLAVSLIPDLRPDTTGASIFASWIILSVALLAAYVPVPRAARLDPMSALRHD